MQFHLENEKITLGNRQNVFKYMTNFVISSCWRSEYGVEIKASRTTQLLRHACFFCCRRCGLPNNILKCSPRVSSYPLLVATCSLSFWDLYKRKSMNRETKWNKSISELHLILWSDRPSEGLGTPEKDVVECNDWRFHSLLAEVIVRVKWKVVVSRMLYDRPV